MTLKSRLRRAIRHPLSVASAAFGGIGALLHPQAAMSLLGALYATAPTLFTGASIASFTLPKVFPFLEVLKPVFLAIIAIAGPLYLLRIVLKSSDKLSDRL